MSLLPFETSMSKPSGVLLLEEYLRRIQRPDETFSQTVDRFAAEVADCAPRTVWRWLAGKSTLGPKTIQKIRDALEEEEEP